MPAWRSKTWCPSRPAWRGSGAKPWVYSIAPFCYARPFEQIRNDVCLNRLGVRLVGNGGGYAYGSMGATHHALEDYGVLLDAAAACARTSPPSMPISSRWCGP